MLVYVTQDVTKLLSNSFIMHGVNCLGVMGAGVAAALAKTHPMIQKRYKWLCNAFESTDLLGDIDVVSVNHSNAFVANLFTQADVKRHGDTKPAACAVSIEKALIKAMEHIERHELDVEIYSVKIGSVLGGLDWDTVLKPIFERVSNRFNRKIYICDL